MKIPENWKNSPLGHDLKLIIASLITITILYVSPLNKTLLGVFTSLLLYFFLPGYAVTQIFFKDKEDKAVFILSLIFSILIYFLWVMVGNFTLLGAYKINYHVLVLFIIVLPFLIHSIQFLKQNQIKKASPSSQIYKKASTINIQGKVPPGGSEKKFSFQKLRPEPSEVEVMKIKESSRDLQVLIFLSLTCGSLIYFLGDTLFRIPAALLLVFLLPGYSLLRCIEISFKEKKWAIRIPSALVLSFFISLGLGLIIKYLNFEPNNILLILMILSVTLLILSYLRSIRHRKNQFESIKAEKKYTTVKTDMQIFKTQNVSKVLAEKIPKSRKFRAKTLSPLYRKNIPAKMKVFLDPTVIVVAISVMGILITFISLKMHSDQTWMLLRVLFTIPLVFFLPGYSLLMGAFYYPLENRNLKWKVLFFNVSVILSVALTLVLGISLVFLNQSQELVIIILALISILGNNIYYLRKKRSEKTSKKQESTLISDSLLKQFPQLKILDQESEDIEDELTSEELEMAHQILKKYEKKKLHPIQPHRKEKKSVDKKMEDKLVKAFPSTTSYQDKKESKTRSKFFNKSSDLLILMVFTLFTIIAIFLPPLNETPLRSVLGLLFVLFIPGYVLEGALFPKKTDLEGIERLALSFGLSLAITPLIGLALNYTPWGIRLTPIVISLTLFTLILAIIAIIRRLKLSEDEVFHPQIFKELTALKKSFDQESRTDQVLTIILLITLVLAVSLTIYLVVSPKEGEKFTEFYILGPEGLAGKYPTNLTVGETGKVIIGVVNNEYSNVTYRLDIRLAGILISQRTLTLEHNQTWEEPFYFTPTTPRTNQKLEFLLYKLPDTQKTYRTLHLWLNVTAAPEEPSK